MYAVFEDGSRQYRVSEGDIVKVDYREADVGADIYYPMPVHRQSYIMERGLHADLPVTDGAADRTLALPIFPALTEAEQDQVIGAVKAAVERHLGPDARRSIAAGATGATSAGSTAGAAAR